MNRRDFLRVTAAGGAICLCGPGMLSFGVNEAQTEVAEISLNGKWQVGPGGRYNRRVMVPGLATDPKKMNDGMLWYRRDVHLGPGKWTHATLTLNGARFCPSIYVNGELVSQSPGGMTITTHLLKSEAVRPGENIILEVALKSLKDIDADDASRIPKADEWRANLSSCLWDNVTLRLHGEARLNRLIPTCDIKNDRIKVDWEFEKLNAAAGGFGLGFEILSDAGEKMAGAEVENAAAKGTAHIPLRGRCGLWSPDNPVKYRLRTVLTADGTIMDTREMTLGIREFKTNGLGFELNGRPIQMRGSTVVWQRWLRDPEAKELGFEVKWFEKNVVKRLKDHGANALHFSLYTPPEAFLDLCDKHGLLVQYEWIFFHGIKASKASMIEQWRAWLDLAMRHPSVVVIHPWNETDVEELKPAWEAMEQLSSEYPPLVVSHRDITHIHKYWWSIFENLGLYYDSAEQFDKPIIADEFGGNYLDGRGEPGRYPTVKESFLRFLGPGHTKATRLQFHTEAASRVAEYWRRIGAAGLGPFCILGSPEDGNHWFMGKLKDGRGKPVWKALTAAFAPLSCSLDVWDRNFVPGQEITIPLYFFNDTDSPAELEAKAGIVAEGKEDTLIDEQTVKAHVEAHSTVKTAVNFKVPRKEGQWRFMAVLQNRQPSVKYPVVSSWRFRTMTVKVPAELRKAVIGAAEDEKELRNFLRDNNLRICGADDPAAEVVVTSRATWEKACSDSGVFEMLRRVIERGAPVVMLDIGPVNLGQGYPKDDNRQATWQQIQIDNPEVTKVALFYGVEVEFKETAEPESHLHPTQAGKALWDNLDPQAAWLWNGLRGGLIVPASNMTLEEVSPDAFVAQWRGRGAEAPLIESESYFAYELQGFYAFSQSEQDTAVMQRLREKVKFLVEDAPSLAVTVNPTAPIQVTNLAEEYRKCRGRHAKSLDVLAQCGRSLSRSAVVELKFEAQQGRLILSQLLTAGRLSPGYGQQGLYGIRYDPAAAQMVLNMVKKSLRK